MSDGLSTIRWVKAAAKPKIRILTWRQDSRAPSTGGKWFWDCLKVEAFEGLKKALGVPRLDPGATADSKKKPEARKHDSIQAYHTVTKSGTSARSQRFEGSIRALSTLEVV